ncbi:hypothetical protein [Streptomyces sp. P9-A2]|uniref:hypothetical protein n=1 Tax=Streptomyces sp. P9-A2 TaxID=3072284 RepID=UPI002FCB8D94
MPPAPVCAPAWRLSRTVRPAPPSPIGGVLPATDATLPADVLDAVDDIVAPGVTVNPVDNSYGDFELRADQRRR